MANMIGKMQNFPFPTGYMGPSRGKGTGEAPQDVNLARAIEDLKEAAAKTPGERARDAILERHGLDEKGYAALKAEDRKAIDEEIADAVERAMGVKDRAETTFIRLG